MGAADCSRAAVLTTSPATMPSPSAGRATSIDDRLAGVDPDPHLELLAAHRVTQERIASAARTARSGSSSCATGAPNTAITASPMNFSTVPPCRSSSVAQPGVVRSEHRADVLGVELLRAAREADQVGEEDGDDLALLARRAASPLKGRRAGRAEAEALRALLAAVRAGQHTSAYEVAVVFSSGCARVPRPTEHDVVLLCPARSLTVKCRSRVASRAAQSVCLAGIYHLQGGSRVPRLGPPRASSKIGSRGTGMSPSTSARRCRSHSPPILRVGLPDRYVAHGPRPILHGEVAFTGRQIAERVEAALLPAA